MMGSPLPDLRGKHRPEPVPPQPHRLVADIDAMLEQNIFYPPKRQRVADVHHKHEADYLDRTHDVGSIDPDPV